MKINKNTIFKLLWNIIVFTVCWVSFGVLSEWVINKWFDSQVILPYAFAAGALSYIASSAIAAILSGFPDEVSTNDRD